MAFDPLILVNILVMVIAFAGLGYLISLIKRLAGIEFKKGMIFLTIGYAVVVIEHIAIAILRRTGTPLDSPWWFIPLPLYLIIILCFLFGSKLLNKIF